MPNPQAPDGSLHHSVTLSIAVSNVEQALGFYAQAFGAREIYRAPDASGRIMHGQVRIGDTILFIAQEQPGDPRSYQAPITLQGTTCALYMYVDDCDAAFQRALAAGASALHPVATRPWGDQEGLVRDLFGHLWAIATRRA